jgi:DNA-directed RNA polymerase specialized sigma24 family protein
VDDETRAEVARRTAVAWPVRRRLIAAARRRLIPPLDPEDAADETLTRFLAAPTTVPDDDVPPYLFGILWHVIAEANRDCLRHEVRAEVAAEESVPGRDVSELVAATLQLYAVLARWRRLPEKQREAVAYDVAGLTVAQAAHRAGVCEGTAKSRLKAARRTLRRVAAPVAALLSLRRARPHRAAVAALAVAAAALVPAVVRVVPDASHGGFADAAPRVVRPTEPRRTPATSRRAEPTTPSGTPAPSPTPTPVPSPTDATNENDAGARDAPRHPGAGRAPTFASPTADRPLLDVLAECVENGVEVTPGRVGCRT